MVHGISLRTESFDQRRYPTSTRNLGNRLAHLTPECTRNIRGRSLLGAAPVRWRHQNPGFDLYLVSGDPRLAHQAITNIDDSRVPDGITQSRYPSSLAQFIPPFSLYWVNMLHDYWMYVDDPELVRATVPHTRTVLDWFTAHLRPDGLLGKMNWWEFANWTANFHYGVPPEDADGGSTLLTLQFVAALRDAADMESSFGNPERASAYRALILMCGANITEGAI